jgi:N-methylhydantoinase A
MQLYGYIAAEEPIQIITLRIEAIGNVPKAEVSFYPAATTDVKAAIIGERTVYLPELGGFTPCPLYDRTLLGPGHVVAGPAVVEQMDSTTLILPSQSATVDSQLNLIIE